MYVLLVNSHHLWCGGSNVVDGMVLDRSLDEKIEGSLVSLTLGLCVMSCRYLTRLPCFAPLYQTVTMGNTVLLGKHT